MISEQTKNANGGDAAQEVTESGESDANAHGCSQRLIADFQRTGTARIDIAACKDRGKFSRV
jgi:hypothetical protein